MEIDKKTLQKRRMMGYFIDAAKQIIDERGIEALSAREVADIAGYNSATLYNYFDDLEHLTFYASLRYLREYIYDLKCYTKSAHTPVERYFKVWECFCHHAYNMPKIFNGIFFGKHSLKLNNAIKDYYSIFPEELEDMEEDIKPMLLGQNIYERNLTLLQPCIKKGYVKAENAEDINEMIILLHQGMLTRLVMGQAAYSPEEAKQRTLFYMKQVFASFGVEV
ncbi:TetR/AcrR family transcriptional regulator [Lutispora saccharofermentans]|uniref:TetR/AcrR family transcriptional regulator n=1 Tax=Lutispora saccharofermentans TaxID=3024236 RepID=A0ABT1NDH0_9FIRM|nr:TetR/AcrR family transcriptional regulator [Lutispora saccharofermentans]MCQ1529305.1 TetR/AcrR family transcriptional regulator [Lutispora saccharofermentans]